MPGVGTIGEDLAVGFVIGLSSEGEKTPPPSQPVAPEFTEALQDMVGNVPDWWQTEPGSNLHALLKGIGESIDSLAWAFQTIYDDQSLKTATEYGLLNNFAYAWGVENERLPPTAEQLRAYIEAHTEEDGSVGSLLHTLTSLLETPQNTTGGPLLQFPAGGEGVKFPTNGEGLHLYQFAPGDEPKGGLRFPANGEGLQFPELPETLTSEETLIADTGETPLGAGSGIKFTENGFCEILQNTPGAYETEVRTLNWLDFDRNAFARAVERFRQAHCLPTRIRELAQTEV